MVCTKSLLGAVYGSGKAKCIRFTDMKGAMWEGDGDFMAGNQGFL